MILGITTAPRPDGANYLRKTIDSSVHAGFGDVIVFAEPDADTGDWPVHHEYLSYNLLRSKQPLGNYGNFKAMAEVLVNHGNFKDEILVTAEDDVEFCGDAAKKIVDTMQPFLAGREQSGDFGFFAAYSASCHQDHLQPHSLAPLKTTSLWGACCLVWTRESLQALLDHKIFKEWRGLDDNRPPVGSPKIKHVDTCISKVMDKLNRKMYFCRPSLVRHVGVVSTLRKKAWTTDRDCNDFAGDKN